MSNLSLVSDSYYKHVSSTNKLILHTVFALFLLTLIFDCLVVFLHFNKNFVTNQWRPSFRRGLSE